MTFVEVDSSHMMAVMMATGVEQVWRGQPTVVFKIPFSEWFSFVKDNKDLLQERLPFDHKKYIDHPELNINWFKVFMWDIVHAQLNELSISSNRKRDATIILPIFDNGDRVFAFEDIVEYSAELDDDEWDKAIDGIWTFRPAPPPFDPTLLSDHNCKIYCYLLGLQHLAMKKDLKSFVVNWR